MPEETNELNQETAEEQAQATQAAETVETQATEPAAQGSAPAHAEQPAKGGITRRSMIFGGIGALAAGAVGGYMLGKPDGEALATQESDIMQKSYAMRGLEHPAGILEPAQQQILIAAYDVITDNRDYLITMLKTWSTAAENMMLGYPVQQPSADINVVPVDTGEAYDLGPANLTITFGFGATFFEKDGKDRFGIKDKKPAPLIEEMRKVQGEYLQPERCGGDLMVQACADDPMVVFHAIHMMNKLAFGVASVKWVQAGYAGTPSVSCNDTPRNPFGFRDGTQASTLKEDEDKMNYNVWIQPEDDKGELYAGGSYFALRRCALLVEAWDLQRLEDQEAAFGRKKLDGAPLSGGDEFTDANFNAVDEEGKPLIPILSHLYATAEENNEGHTFLRRSYSYLEGIDKLGQLQAGLAFIGFSRDPNEKFVRLMESMNGTDLMEYVQYEGSAVFLVPPAMGETDQYVGQMIFEG